MRTVATAPCPRGFSRDLGYLGQEPTVLWLPRKSGFEMTGHDGSVEFCCTSWHLFSAWVSHPVTSAHLGARAFRLKNGLPYEGGYLHLLMTKGADFLQLVVVDVKLSASTINTARSISHYPQLSLSFRDSLATGNIRSFFKDSPSVSECVSFLDSHGRKESLFYLSANPKNALVEASSGN
jgi:hypothetical protein